MSKYTVDEKLKYHDAKGDDFGFYYSWGVRSYREYPKASKEEKARIDRTVQSCKIVAKRDKEPWAKAFLCGFRDAANERKAKRNPHFPS